MARNKPISPARLAAFDILRRVEDGAYSSILLAQRAGQLDERDRALCQELVMGVLRRQLWLDELAQHFVERQVRDLDLPVRLILRLALYQLRFLSRIPASAIVNESVNLATHARLRSAGAFVNAVLRRAARETEIDPAGAINDPIKRIAISTSHPPWLIERWTEAFGMTHAEAFARANNQAPPIAFRVVGKQASDEALLAKLREQGATLTPSEIARYAWRFRGPSRLLSDLVAAGKIYVQDEASQLAAQILDPQPGERVLDLCAAPGSKSTQIADAMQGTGLVVACDLYSHRLATIATTARLHKLENIRLLLLDGLNPLPFCESFDRVLVDAPCSGTGTLRRNPEIRWRISAADIADLSARQKQLLFNASRVVKPGGRLVYSTCSVEREENESVAQEFLDNNNNFSLLELPQQDPALMPGAMRTWPHRHDTDGFFMAAFERKR